RAQASEFADRLEANGAKVIQFPTIKIQPLERVDMPSLDKYDWVIFTSVNAVEIFYERLRENGKDVRAFGGIEICAVGPKTVEALNDIGIQPDFVPMHSRGSAIAAEIEDISGKKILLPRAKIATTDLPKGLRDRGAHVNDVPLYDTVKVASDGAKKRDEIEMDLLDGRIDLVTFTSSSTVNNFLEMFPKHTPETLLADVQIAVIGPETQKAAIKQGIQVNVIAKKATIESLVEAIIAAYHSL
ncbi:MAG: uroporphyrinogen-III synthase, partial [Candidatus Poribacteria bacterium]|nr:uroporphyrinogen-III synthase [Candidatus Poribacteria bacterium]